MDERMEALAVCVGVVLLLGLSVPSAFAEIYEIVAVGAVHVEDDTVVVTPVYGTDVLLDDVNGILRFKVLEHPLGYEQLLGAGKNTTDVTKPIDALPILETLSEGDIVELNFKDCEYSEKMVQPIPLTDNYLIAYVGQANSVTINAVEIPEFTGFLLLTVFMSATFTAILLRKSVLKEKLRAQR